MANVAIGKQIQAVVKKRGMKVEELAKRLNVSKPNIYDIYRRNSIDTGLLERLCKVLDHNFFEQYAHKYRTQHERDSYEYVVRENTLLKQMVRDKDELYQLAKAQLELVRK
jgi:transcriptional regulator with XRE-family HTH domain